MKIVYRYIVSTGTGEGILAILHWLAGMIQLAADGCVRDFIPESNIFVSSCASCGAKNVFKKTSYYNKKKEENISIVP